MEFLFCVYSKHTFNDQMEQNIHTDAEESLIRLSTWEENHHTHIWLDCSQGDQMFDASDEEDLTYLT